MASVRPLAIVAGLAALTVAGPAPAATSLDVEPAGTTVTAPGGGGETLVVPGDTVDLTTRVKNTGASLTGVSGQLSTSTTGVSVIQPSSPFPDAGFGTTVANSTPFGLAVDAGVECGSTLDLSLTLTASEGTATLLYRVGTGVAGAFAATDLTPGRTIPDDGELSSSFTVAEPGRLKDIRVRIGRITHNYVSDLVISIDPPYAAPVVLMDGQGGTGDDVVDAVFAPSGPRIQGASAPFTGSWQSQDDLSPVIGTQQQGTWTLRVRDKRRGNDPALPGVEGVLHAWGADVAPAVCGDGPIPSFTATPNPVTPGGTVIFDGSATRDFDGGAIQRYEWDLDGDGTFELGGGTTEVGAGARVTVSRTYPAAGDVAVRMRATDDEGKTATRTLTVKVTTPPSAAIIATPAAPSTGEPVSFSAADSTDDGAIVRYEWDLDGDGSFERDTGTTATTSHSYATPGTVNARARVTDDAGLSSVAGVDVAVGNRLPTASFTHPSPAVSGRAAQLDAAASADPEGTALSYAWDLDGNGSFEAGPSATATQSVTFPTAGTRRVGLRVTDAHGGLAQTTRDVLVTDAPVVVLTASPAIAAPGQTVSFDASGSFDPDGSIARYGWDLDGNGRYETETTGPVGPSRSYPNAGAIQVSVRAVDDRGAATVRSTTVTVQEPPPVVLDEPSSVDGGGGGTSTGEATATTPTTTTAGGAAGGLAPSTDLGTLAPAPPAAAQDGERPSVIAFTASLVGPSIQRLRRALRRGVSVPCRSAEAARCSVRLELAARDARRYGLARKPAKRRRASTRPVVLARRSVSVAADGSKRVALRLRRTAKRKLRRVRRLRVVVRATATDAAGQRVRLTRVVLLRR